MFCPSTLTCRMAASESAGTSYVPLRCATALPIFSVEGSRTPWFLRKSYFVLKSTTTGTAAGEPPATSNALESFALPLKCASPFFDAMLAFRSSRPPSPAEGSSRPVVARFRLLMVSLAFTGVSAVFSWSRGPAVPSSLRLPPPGRLAVSVTGNWVVRETLDAARSTLSYLLRFWELVEPITKLPFRNSSFSTENSPALDGAEGFCVSFGGGGACFSRDFAAEAPNEE